MTLGAHRARHYHAPMHLIRRSAPAVSIALVLLLAACGSGAATPSPSEPSTPTLSVSPTASAEPTEEATAEPTPTVEVTPTPDTTVEDAWRATAVDHRADVGEQFSYECPARGEASNIWGTDLYTDDSSVCTAGVHTGTITFEEGGSVTIEIRAGADEYVPSERNGVTSLVYGPWGGSFVVVDD